MRGIGVQERMAMYRVKLVKDTGEGLGRKDGKNGK